MLVRSRTRLAELCCQARTVRLAGREYGNSYGTITLLAILEFVLGGGKKKGQQHDIATPHERWKDYKQRKSQEK